MSPLYAKRPREGGRRGSSEGSGSRLRLLRTYGRRRSRADVSLVKASLRCRGLLDYVPGTARIDLDARTHRGGERDGADVAPLGRRRLRADQLVHHCGVVLEQAALVQVALADHKMDDRVSVGPVLHL